MRKKSDGSAAFLVFAVCMIALSIIFSCTARGQITGTFERDTSPAKGLSGQLVRVVCDSVYTTYYKTDTTKVKIVYTDSTGFVKWETGLMIRTYPANNSGWLNFSTVDDYEARYLIRRKDELIEMPENQVLLTISIK